MPTNFANLKLRFLDSVRDNLEENFSLLLNLSSINFDINHTTIGPDTPFTTEIAFDLNIEEDALLTATTIQELNSIVRDFYRRPNVGEILTFEDLIKSRIFTSLTGDDDGVLDNGNFNIQYNDFSRSNRPTNQSPFNQRASRANIIVSRGFSNEDTDLITATWKVRIKYHSTGVTTRGENQVDNSLVFFPELILNTIPDDVESGAFLAPDKDSEFLLTAFNEELKQQFELLYTPTVVGTLDASPLGRVADELNDSLSNLANTISSNLSSTIKTQLQPFTDDISSDMALWALIRKGTEELSFNRFQDYMDDIFCGTNLYNTGRFRTKNELLDNRRSLPFMGVDAYRAVKVATEAFVMVNCMTKPNFTAADVEDFLKRVPQNRDMSFNEQKLTQYYDDYKVKVNGGVSTIPYLAVIYRKFRDEDIKRTPFADAFENYLGGQVRTADNCYGVLSEKLATPCFLELIWSYWHEESMMVQGLSAISRRFQNIRGAGQVDPLANLEIDPLRPLNNLMWGYIQDEQHRLTVRRRAYEYDHHYGISLRGTATKDMRFADSRSKFIEAFHSLLNIASRFYKQADDMTVQPDGFPILNALRETHLVLSEGAHNQWGDLPSVARAEMLMQQWLFARPEFREFLPARAMVAYPEPWMDRVAALNNMMGWTKTSILHYNFLAVTGERILLGIRFGNWSDANLGRDAASNWARFWRQDIQTYIHSYRAVTGVDLSADGVAAGQKVDTQQPSAHLWKLYLNEKRKNSKPSSTNKEFQY